MIKNAEQTIEATGKKPLNLREYQAKAKAYNNQRSNKSLSQSKGFEDR